MEPGKLKPGGKTPIVRSAKAPAQRIVDLEAEPQDTQDIVQALVRLHLQMRGPALRAIKELNAVRVAYKGRTTGEIVSEIVGAVPEDVQNGAAGAALAKAFNQSGNENWTGLAMALQAVQRSDATWTTGTMVGEDLPAEVCQRGLLAMTQEQRAAALAQMKWDEKFRVDVEAAIAVDEAALAILISNPKDLVGALKPPAKMVRGEKLFALFGQFDHGRLIVPDGPLFVEFRRRHEQAEAEAKAKAEAEKATKPASAPTKVVLSEDEETILEAIAAGQEKIAKLAASVDGLWDKTQDWQAFVAGLQSKARQIAQAEEAAKPKPPSAEEVAKRIEAALANIRKEVRQALSAGRGDIATSLVSEVLKQFGRETEAEAHVRQEHNAMIRERAPQIRQALGAGEVQTAQLILMELGVYENIETKEAIEQILSHVGANEQSAPAPKGERERVLKLGPVEIEFGGSEPKDPKAARRAELEDPMMGLKKLRKIAASLEIAVPATLPKEGPEVQVVKESLVEAILAKEFGAPEMAEESVEPEVPAPAPVPVIAAPPPTMPEEVPASAGGFQGEVSEVSAEVVLVAVQAEAPQPEPVEAVFEEEEDEEDRLAKLPPKQRKRVEARLARERARGGK